MGAAAAPLMAEAVMAESFAAAAPAMFTGTGYALAPVAAGTLGTGVGIGALEGLGGLSALGSEFGTAGLFAEAGTNASILNAIGAGSGAAVPTLAEGVAQGVTTGGLGMGEAGINEALVNAEQVQAAKDLSQFTNAFENADAYAQGIREAYPATEKLASFNNMVSPSPAAAETVNFTGYDGLAAGNAREAALRGLGRTVPELAPQVPPNSLANGFNQAMDFAKKNPFSAASMAYTASNLLKPSEEEKPEEYNGILKYYKMSPNFQGRQANPADFQYATKTYADGGIASYKYGGKTERTDLDPTGGSKIAGDYYESMLSEQARNMPSTKSDPGIIYDTDPDTRSLDPVSAAQIRMAKINKRSNVQAQNMKRPTRLGQINLSPPNTKAEAASSSLDPETMAAQGGIMHANLGGYAAGGNPRLLRGPGDGMSDNIPATIAGKQPARLADGEFVIPADVVSHLGNGSTEAGAKILHEMMNKVRRARTGNSKQGKQINPRKFVPT